MNFRMSPYVTEFFMIQKYGIWAFKHTFNHDHSTIQATYTISYIAMRPYVEFNEKFFSVLRTHPEELYALQNT